VVRAASKSDFIGTEGALERLQQTGFTVRRVTMCEDINAVCDLISVIELCSLIRREGFDIVHTYTSKAGFIGRLGSNGRVTIEKRYSLDVNAPKLKRVLEQAAAC